MNLRSKIGELSLLPFDQTNSIYPAHGLQQIFPLTHRINPGDRNFTAALIYELCSDNVFPLQHVLPFRLRYPDKIIEPPIGHRDIIKVFRGGYYTALLIQDLILVGFPVVLKAEVALRRNNLAGGFPARGNSLGDPDGVFAKRMA